MDCLFNFNSPDKVPPLKTNLKREIALLTQSSWKQRKQRPLSGTTRCHGHKCGSRRLFALIIGSLIITRYSAGAAVWISFWPMYFQGFLKINGLWMSLAEGEISWQPASLLPQHRKAKSPKSYAVIGLTFLWANEAIRKTGWNADRFPALDSAVIMLRMYVCLCF